jgi:hypothetical protein
MVFFQAKVPDRDADQPGFPEQRQRTQESDPADDTASVPLGVNMKVWFSIIKILRVPHFSFTNRMGFQHEHDMPLVLGGVVEPRLSPSVVLFLTGDPRPCHAHRVAHHMCSQCYEEMFTHNERLGVLVCGHCGTQSPYYENFSYKPFSRARILPRTISDDFYKRTIYFREWLRRLQAREKCRISAHDLDRVRVYMGRISMTYWDVKACLKALRLQKYYDHIVFIMKALRGTPLFEMTRTQEDRLVKLFCQLRSSFLDLENERVNMLSYPYIISKLCELQGWMRVSKIIPTLKSAMRIKEQDELWYRICRSRGWRFIPTPTP